MHVDAGTAECRHTSHRGGPRVSGLGVALALVQSLIVVVLTTLATAGGSASDAPAATSPAAHPVAYVNGTPIMSDRLELAVNALIPQESFHRSVSAEKVEALRQQALDGLLNDELQYQHAAARGLSASADEVNEGMRAVAARYPTPEAFAAAIRRAHLTETAVRGEVRRTVLIRKAHDEAVTAQCGVTETAAAGYFEANRGRFVVPEQLHIQAITIGVDPSSPPATWAAAKARAAQVRRRVLEGASFEAMARQYSTDSTREQGGDMGYFHRGSLADEFEKATAGLRVGQVSAVVQTIYGYHVVRIADVRLSRQKTFTEVSADLQRDLTAKRCAELNEAWLDRLRAGADIRRVDHVAADGSGRPSPPGGTR